MEEFLCWSYACGYACVQDPFEFVISEHDAGKRGLMLPVLLVILLSYAFEKGRDGTALVPSN